MVFDRSSWTVGWAWYLSSCKSVYYPLFYTPPKRLRVDWDFGFPQMFPTSAKISPSPGEITTSWHWRSDIWLCHYSWTKPPPCYRYFSPYTRQFASDVNLSFRAKGSSNSKPSTSTRGNHFSCLLLLRLYPVYTSSVSFQRLWIESKNYKEAISLDNPDRARSRKTVNDKGILII